MAYVMKLANTSWKILKKFQLCAGYIDQPVDNAGQVE